MALKLSETRVPASSGGCWMCRRISEGEALKQPVGSQIISYDTVMSAYSKRV